MFGPNPEQDRLRTFQDTMIEYDNGIHIRGTDLWFDAKRKTNFCFVSHAHADHAIKHNAILTTKETARFFEHRYGRAKFHTVEYNRAPRFSFFHPVTFWAVPRFWSKPAESG
jgi:phosphoribosyl 1,2-cyclic phosphodiesterase